jgi:threonyl-tRNA synthetase
VLAQAVKRLYPDVKLAIGPSIADGFYYDMDAPFAFTPEILTKIEAEMRKICKEKLKLERFELPREEALKFMEEKGEPYKVELINDLPAGRRHLLLQAGRLHRPVRRPPPGLHRPHQGQRHQADRLQRAYWRGDSSRKQLQRIYGVAFPKKDELDEYLRSRRRPASATTTRSAASWSTSPRWTSSARACPSCCPRAPASSSCSALGGGRGAEARLSAHQDAVYGQARAL